MTRRVVRLFVLLGAVAAAYLVLSLFDHAARADTGSIGVTDPVASVKVVTANAGKAIPKSPLPEAAAAKPHLQSIQRRAAKAPEVHAPSVPAAKKVQAPTPVLTIRTGETVRRVQSGSSKLRQPTSDAVRATVTPARTVVVARKLPTLAQAPSLPKLAPGLPLAALASSARLPDLSQLPSLSQLPGVPLAPLPAWPQLPGMALTQATASPQLPGLSLARTAVHTRPSTPGPNQPISLSVPVQTWQLPAFAPASGLTGVAKPPAAQAQPQSAPIPASPRQPADNSTPAGQASNSGGGNAPATGTVSSTWRPEMTAAGRSLASDLIVRGRTSRYAGPPS